MLSKQISYCLLLLSLVFSTPSFAQDSTLKWQILGDILGRYKHTKTQPPTFELGDIDLWFQKQINRQWKALGEIIIMDMGSPGNPMHHLHPVRTFIEYFHNETFQLRIGQMHTPIGEYNQLYPHGGRFFEPTIHRPHLAQVKTGEELMSFHTVGLNARGLLNLSDRFDLHYIVGIGNGDPHAGVDANSFKSPYLKLSLFPNDISGLSISLSHYINKISGLEYTNGEDLYEIVSHAGMLYESYPIEFLLEGFWIQHGGSFEDILNRSINGSVLPYTSTMGGTSKVHIHLMNRLSLLKLKLIKLILMIL